VTTIVAVANQKGGVGKTTTTFALGAALAERGQRVLLVDLDPQASLTSAAGLEPDELEQTLYTAIAAYLKDQETMDVIALRRSLGERLDLLPANIELSVAEMELQTAVRREYILGELLEPARRAYDIVLIDCPPSLSLLTLNGLTVADEVIIPLVPEYLAARGLGLLLKSIQRVRKAKLNPRLAIAGIILTMTDHRTTHGKEIAASIQAHIASQAPLLGEIRRTIKVSESTAVGQPITHYAAQSEAAQAYGQIADRLLTRWSNKAPAAAPLTTSGGARV
jgi:chromosome partitioning protein